MAFGDFTVVRAGTKNVLNSSGVLASVANNVPAFEFNTDGTYRGLLVEPGGTNLLVRSSEFNTTWGKSDITVTDNSIASPDGTTTADTITEGTAGSAFLSQGATVSAGATVTGSIWLKVGSVNDFIRIAISQSGTFGNNVVTWFRFSTGVLSGTANSGTGTGATASVQSFPNGWYRISLSGAIPAVTGYIFSVNSASASGSGTRVNNSVYYAWGAQLETGSVATSYIPTVASTANRVADSVTLTGASSLIGQAGGGTLFLEVDWRLSTGTSQNILFVSDGSSGNRMGIYVNATENQLRMIGAANSVSQTNQGVTTVGISGVNRIAMRYKQDDAVLFRNGSSVSADTSFNISALASMGNISIGADQAGGLPANMWIRSVALFATPLTDAQIIALTTL
jgi:hypothetical protein